MSRSSYFLPPLREAENRGTMSLCDSEAHSALVPVFTSDIFIFERTLLHTVTKILFSYVTLHFEKQYRIILIRNSTFENCYLSPIIIWVTIRISIYNRLTYTSRDIGSSKILLALPFLKIPSTLPHSDSHQIQIRVIRTRLSLRLIFIHYFLYINQSMSVRRLTTL